ncbi:hypothetical protein GQ607_014886 [Colletotrichum asianum]|uniref:Uncharacterized protein n=1 Tax=Colletotrichum asianum TaxID=702518 RepID=A0A8H3W214_9PEZI|nr:hypothetical protein GQ607_014886 [Colletotrichum asianum]
MLGGECGIIPTHTALKTAFDSLDKAFNVLIAADPSGWGPNGRLSTLEEKHDALQARYDTLQGEFVALVRGVLQVRRELRACEAHTAQGGDFRRLRASVMQLDRKFLVFGRRSGRVTALEAEVAYLTERLEALENASLS